jgi:UDP-N-acetylmuramate-alanine ligase
VVRRVDDMARVVADVAVAGDLVLTLGAGSISSLAPALVSELEHRHPPGRVH